MSTKGHTTRQGLLCAWTRSRTSCLAKRVSRGQCDCSIFAFVEPLGGRHHVCALQHRTATDWALQIKYLVDVMYPDVEKITLVMDNLNTHAPSSLYKAFAPHEANRIWKRLEVHYAPKHGS